MSEAPKSRASHPFAWVSTTYFAEGYPYSIVNFVADVFYKERGASLEVIGLTSLFHLPWNLKFLWGPVLDAFLTKRAWLVWMELAIAIVLVGLAFVSSLDGVLGYAAVAFMVLGVLSATHDIAIDGYYLEALDEAGQSRFVGFRAAAYRAAMVFVSGPIILLSSERYLGFAGGFALAAVIMGALLAYHFAFLPRVERPKRPARALLSGLLSLRFLFIAAVVALLVLAARAIRPRLQAALPPALAGLGVAEWIAIGLAIALVLGALAVPALRRRIDASEFYARAFVDFLDQPQVGRILAFVVLFRTGESFLMKMRYPFLVSMGMTQEQYGVAYGIVGVGATIVAVLLGGWAISKFGLARAIWPCVLAQNLLNLLFWGAASMESVGVYLLSAIIAVEAFGAGLGTAVFMVFLMRCCRPDFKAAHMAIVTALMSVSFTFAGVASGFITEWIGYGPFFLFSFFATVPGMALIPFLPHVKTAAPGSRGAASESH